MSNQQDIYAIRAERLADTHDPSVLMANTQTPFYLDQSSHITYKQHPQPNNNYVQQPPFNMNYMQQLMKNLEDISDPTTVIDMALVLMAKSFKLNNTTPTNNNQRSSSNPHNMQIAQPRNQLGHNAVQNSNIQKTANSSGNGNVVAAHVEGNVKPRKWDDAYLQTQLQIAQKEEARDNLQQASTSGTHTDSAPVYDSDGSAEKMALGYQNLFHLEQAQEKQQSLYNGKVLLEKHDPPDVYDSEEALQLAQEIRLKMKQLNKEIKPANYAKINQLLEVFDSQKAKSSEELYLLNTSKTASVSKSISIPNEEFSDDTSPSVARKFLNEVKSTIVTLQRVVKQKMTLDIHNWLLEIVVYKT
uniref:Gag-Pol polyprotein n=1 Tax=Tanacetum cinerariifolium TaxID=118510 RepID=A0A6L2LFD0_TANCI|nr:hypothetical protein [Tanacetum cinerariifolium]